MTATGDNAAQLDLDIPRNIDFEEQITFTDIDPSQYTWTAQIRATTKAPAAERAKLLADITITPGTDPTKQIVLSLPRATTATLPDSAEWDLISLKDGKRRRWAKGATHSDDTVTTT